MVPNGPFLEKWTILILGSAVHHNARRVDHETLAEAAYSICTSGL